jgi:hypothetical protein
MTTIENIHLEKIQGMTWDYGFGKYGLGIYLWSWDGLVLFIPDRSSQRLKTNYIFEANDMLRSCLSVIKRRGKDTNWEAIEKKIRKVLENYNPYVAM